MKARIWHYLMILTDPNVTWKHWTVGGFLTLAKWTVIVALLWELLWTFIAFPLATVLMGPAFLFYPFLVLVGLFVALFVGASFLPSGFTHYVKITLLCMVGAWLFVLASLVAWAFLLWWVFYYFR